ncbi:MAG: hypothetical protein ABFD64_00345 [Armatimonadota bacterium]
MRRYLILAVAIVVVVAVVGNHAFKRWSYIRATTDVTDRDFIATISTTDTPLVVDVEVSKVNPVARKQIKGIPKVFDLSFKSKSGHVYGGKYTGQIQYASLVSGKPFIFGKPSDSLRYRLRIITTNLKPGTYKVSPYVRITESGDDALSGPYADGGTVAVPAGNSIKVTIKK